MSMSPTSLFDNSRPGSNLPEYGVGELSKLLKKTVEDNFGQVRVRGEISGLKVAPSGHIYFDLKDEDALLASVCWRGQAGKLGIKLESGMEIVCTGRLTTYMLRSNYQLVVEQVALAGVGALLKLLEERKKKLAAEGLFDPGRKQLLPFLPNVIGVITSPTGAVIRDILHRLADRFPRHVLVWPVAVQGEGAPEQIAKAIEGFNNLRAGGDTPRPDLLIVARGGGSIEDLMAFNEEIVVRAAATSHIPLISAVGHETDTTLIDFAADVRAPTPTAAAEMAVPVRENLLNQVETDGHRLSQALRRHLDERRERVRLFGQALGDPKRVFEPLLQRFDERSERFKLGWEGFLGRQASKLAEAAGRIRHPRDIVKLAAQKLEYFDHKLDAGFQNTRTRKQNQLLETSGRISHPRDLLRLAAQNLNTVEHKIAASWREYFFRKTSQIEKIAGVLTHLSPRAVLGRGYALIQGADGHVVTSREAALPGSAIHIEFHDGKRGAKIDD